MTVSSSHNTNNTHLVALRHQLAAALTERDVAIAARMVAEEAYVQREAAIAALQQENATLRGSNNNNNNNNHLGTEQGDIGRLRMYLASALAQGARLRARLEQLYLNLFTLLPYTTVLALQPRPGNGIAFPSYINIGARLQDTDEQTLDPVVRASTARVFHDAAVSMHTFQLDHPIDFPVEERVRVLGLLAGMGNHVSVDDFLAFPGAPSEEDILGVPWTVYTWICSVAAVVARANGVSEPERTRLMPIMMFCRAVNHFFINMPDYQLQQEFELRVVLDMRTSDILYPLSCLIFSE